jgi:hypothetical protein
MARRIATATLGLLLAGAAGCVSVGDVDTKAAKDGYLDERESVQIVTTLLGGKNVFIPSTVVLSEGSGRRLTIYNTTDTPHGFQIPTLGVTAVLQPGQENVVALPPLEGGRIYNMICHLHPPHRHATLMVVRGP